MSLWITFLKSESFFQNTKYLSQGENEDERNFWYQTDNMKLELDAHDSVHQPNPTQG